MKISSLILCICCFMTTLSFAQKAKKKVHKKVKKVKIVAKAKPQPAVEENTASSSTTQGICGTIVWKSGNMMPSPDRPIPPPKPIERELLVYELTNIAQATLQDGFYTAIASTLIKTVKSDVQGRFCVDLPEGSYSLLVREGEKGLFANSFDDKGNILPVTVGKDKVSIIVFTVDYQAVY
ncbi:hypothetical protein [Arcicella aurantiaca]|nr:hypothetical protein [Arcicella aurantiaca]